MDTIDKLQLLYEQLDQQKAAGEDVVSELRKEINNLELTYLKEEVLPKVAQTLGAKIGHLRCEIDCNLQYDENGRINYTFCKSGSILMIKDSVDIKVCMQQDHFPIKTSECIETDDKEHEIKNNHKAEQSLLEEEWLNRMLNMKYSINKGIKAPHKLIFILAIIDNIRKGYIKDCRIYPTDNLEKAFKRLWSKHVPSYWPFSNNMYQPFVHLSSEQFYTLEMENKQIRFDLNQGWNRKRCLKFFKYGILDMSFFTLLKDDSFSMRLEKMIIDYQRKLRDAVLRNEPIEDKEEKDSQIELTGFRDYLHTLASSIGRPYSEPTIALYISSLKSGYLRGIISDFVLSENIEDVTSIDSLKDIFDIVDRDSLLGMTNKAVVLAVKLYIEYRTMKEQNMKSAAKLSLPIQQPSLEKGKSGKSKYIVIKSIIAGHIHITEGNPTSMLIQFINEVGPEVVENMHIPYLGGELVSKYPNPKYLNAAKKLNNGFWLTTNSSTKTKINQIKMICSYLGLSVDIVLDDGFEISESVKNFPSNGRLLYSLNGGAPLNKRQSVFACVRLFMNLNPDVSFEVVQRNFPAELQGGYGVVTKISTVNDRIRRGYDDEKRYFMNEDQILTDDGGVKFVVCKEWGNQFDKFRKHVQKRFGWTLKESES